MSDLERELEELRRFRDSAQTESNRDVELRRLMRTVGEYVCSRWPGDPKQRGRKLLEEAAELSVNLSDQWRMKQYGLQHVSDEIGDVLIVLASICHMLRIDPGKAMADKFSEVQSKK